MRPMLLVVVAAALVAACGRGGASPLPADQPPTFNDTDVGFLQAMIPHHQQAIDMAKLVEGRTQRPELVKLATSITASQGAEIRTMQGFLTRWNRPAPAAGEAGHDEPQAPGMLGQGQLDWLKTLEGVRFDLGFVTMMRTHHGGAVEMAEAELRSGSSASIKTLAKRMIAAQQAEIRQLQGWKDAWS
jgi:uncharacterized protein (DUF305 family)